MLRILTFLLILFLPVAVYAQQPVTEIKVFDGENEIQLPDSIHAQLQQNPDSKKQILLRWLGEIGYLNASIQQIDEEEAQISRNCAFILDEFIIQYTGETDSVISEYPDITYTQKALNAKIDALLNELAGIGYPFAEVSITSFSPDYNNCSLMVELTVDEGGKVQSSEIFFTGSEVNSQDYLEKVSRFQTGEYITPQYLRYLRSNLNSSELFNYVSEGQILLREGNPVVVFEVQERSMNRFDGLLGYVPDASGKGQIVGDISLSLWNVLSQGSGLNFEYQRLRPETSELNLGISQDWIGNIPVGISAGFQIYQNDTTYQSREAELNGYYRISSGFKITGGINYQATTSGSGSLNIIEPDGRKRTANLGFQYSTLNSYEVPTSGVRFELNYGVSNKNLEGDSAGSFIQNSLRVNVSQFISIRERSVIALSTQAFLLEADKITTNDLMRFGGANSFRGYSEQQFRAGRLLWGDVEYRFMLDRSSFLFAFGAVGGYHRPKLITDSNNSFQVTDYLYSTGFGLSYMTQIGRLKFTYAVSPEESIANGKVHFGITTQF